MSDEGFHEIQLGGKQLIFLFMTAALVLVVAFLSGVLVGRGVRVQKDASLAAADAGQAAAALDPSPAPASAADAAQQPAAPPVTAIAPPTPAEEELSYDSRLEDAKPPAETLGPKAEGQGAPARAAATPAAATPAPARPPANTNAPASTRPATAPAPKAPVVAEAGKGEPAGSGYYLKIVAFRERGQADAVAKRLGGKGYSSYIVPLSGKGPVLYSVRVGKYKTRREADVARRRLEKEEQFKPLISH